MLTDGEDGVRLVLAIDRDELAGLTVISPPAHLPVRRVAGDDVGLAGMGEDFLREPSTVRGGDSLGGGIGHGPPSAGGHVELAPGDHGGVDVPLLAGGGKATQPVQTEVRGRLVHVADDPVLAGGVERHAPLLGLEGEDGTDGVPLAGGGLERHAVNLGDADGGRLHPGGHLSHQGGRVNLPCGGEVVDVQLGRVPECGLIGEQVPQGGGGHLVAKAVAIEPAILVQHTALERRVAVALHGTHVHRLDADSRDGGGELAAARDIRAAADDDGVGDDLLLGLDSARVPADDQPLLGAKPALGGAHIHITPGEDIVGLPVDEPLEGGAEVVPHRLGDALRVGDGIHLDLRRATRVGHGAVLAHAGGQTPVGDGDISQGVLQRRAGGIHHSTHPVGGEDGVAVRPEQPVHAAGTNPSHPLTLGDGRVERVEPAHAATSVLAAQHLEDAVVHLVDDRIADGTLHAEEPAHRAVGGHLEGHPVRLQHTVDHRPGPAAHHAVLGTEERLELLPQGGGAQVVRPGGVAHEAVPNLTGLDRDSATGIRGGHPLGGGKAAAVPDRAGVVDGGEPPRHRLADERIQAGGVLPVGRVEGVDGLLELGLVAGGIGRGEVGGVGVEERHGDLSAHLRGSATGSTGRGRRVAEHRLHHLGHQSLRRVVHQQRLESLMAQDKGVGVLVVDEHLPAVVHIHAIGNLLDGAAAGLVHDLVATDGILLVQRPHGLLADIGGTLVALEPEAVGLCGDGLLIDEGGAGDINLPGVLLLLDQQGLLLALKGGNLGLEPRPFGIGGGLGQFVLLDKQLALDHAQLRLGAIHLVRNGGDSQPAGGILVGTLQLVLGIERGGLRVVGETLGGLAANLVDIDLADPKRDRGSRHLGGVEEHEVPVGRHVEQAVVLEITLDLADIVAKRGEGLTEARFVLNILAGDDGEGVGDQGGPAVGGSPAGGQRVDDGGGLGDTGGTEADASTSPDGIAVVGIGEQRARRGTYGTFPGE